MAPFAPLRNSNIVGRQVEKASLVYLKKQGLRLLNKNFHSKMGEIDLIMLEENTVVFIEVRYRKKSSYGDPIETVGYHKRRKLLLTAQYYLQTQRQNKNDSCRFDILGVSTYNAELNFNWLKNAFSFEDI
jgi:putative endonuclease